MRNAGLRQLLLAVGLPLLLLLLPVMVQAQDMTVLSVRDADGGQDYSVKLQILLLMTVLSLIPGIVLMMTSFTRIIIVLAILRQALGLAQSPPNRILIGIALMLSLLVFIGEALRDEHQGEYRHHHGTQPRAVAAQAALQHGGVAFSGNAVSQGTGPAQAGAEGLQAVGQCAKGAGHGAGVHHGHDGQAKALGQIGSTRVAIKQAHDAFHQDQVRLLGGLAQALAAIGVTGHPQIELIHRCATGELVPVGV